MSLLFELERMWFLGWGKEEVDWKGWDWIWKDSISYICREPTLVLDKCTQFLLLTGT